MNRKFKEYFRVKISNNKLVLQVREIRWDGPCTPISKWTTAKSLDTSIELNELDDEIKLLLKNKKYFSCCTKCNKHFARGNMHSDKCCHGCAERYLGVVY